MAYEIIRPNFQLPVLPASTVVPRTPVKLVGSNALRVLPVGTSTDQIFAMVGEATAPVSGAANSAVQGFAAQLLEPGNIVKAIAAASFAAGVEVMVGTIGVATLAQGGSYVATVPQFITLAAASGAAIWSAGFALDTGIAGELFTLYLRPRQTGGLA